MSLHVRVTLTTSYQKASVLIKAAYAALGLAEPRTNFTKIKYLPDSAAVGPIYGTRNPAIAGYDMLLNTNDEEIKQSQNNTYTELTTDIWLKSANNGDLLNIELFD